MVFAFLYVYLFFGIVQVIWCKPKGFEKHRNWRLVSHHHCGIVPHRNTTLVPRISEGGDTDIAKLPWLVKLYIQDVISGKHKLLCGGTVISNRYVLSAAHCVADYNEKYLSVGLGSTSVFKNDLKIKVQSVTIHPKYDICETDIADSSKNDISLIRLEKKIQFKDTIQPICLPNVIDVEQFGPNTTMEIAGWGDLGKGMQGSKTLQYKNVSLLPKWKCSAKGIKYLMFGSKKFKEINFTCLTPLDKTQLCVTGGADKGDSGAPLMIAVTIGGKPTYFIIGVTSYIVMYVATVYTNVHEFIAWILDHIKP